MERGQTAGRDRWIGDARSGTLALVLGLVTAACSTVSPASPTPLASAGPTPRPTPEPITMQAPSEVNAGETFEVSWTGKEQNGDGIYIVEVGRTRLFGTDEGCNTNLGSPGTLVAPTTPGAYEIWFVEEETVDHIKARLSLTVT